MHISPTDKVCCRIFRITKKKAKHYVLRKAARVRKSEGEQAQHTAVPPQHISSRTCVSESVTGILFVSVKWLSCVCSI